MILFSIKDKDGDALPVKFGLSISQVLEISHPQRVIPVPMSPTGVVGLIDWRGIPVPVIDMAKQPGYEPSTQAHEQRLLITRDELRRPIAFMVDSEIQTKRLPMKSNPIDAPPELNGDFVKALFQTAEGPIMIPELQKLTLEQVV